MPIAATTAITLVLAIALAIGAGSLDAKEGEAMNANQTRDTAQSSTLQPARSWTTPFAAHEGGAGYRTVKTMFGRDVPVIGKTEAFDTQVAWSDEGSAMLWARIEHAALRSGNGPRDSHVSKLLGGTDAPYIQIQSRWIPRDTLHEGIARGALEVPATISIDSRQTPLALDLRFIPFDDRILVQVHAATTFSELGIEVPRVGPFGLIATPQEPLELFGQFPSDAVAGAALVLADAKVGP